MTLDHNIDSRDNTKPKCISKVASRREVVGGVGIGIRVEGNWFYDTFSFCFSFSLIRTFWV